MIEKNRVVRTIFGLAFTIVFAIFAYLSCKVSPHSSECDPTSPNYDPYSYGYDRVKYLQSGRTVQPIRDNLDTYQSAVSGASSAASAEEILAAMQAAGTLPEEYADLVPAAADTPAEETESASDTAALESENSGATVNDISVAIERAQEKGLPTPPDININDWQYMLVNSTHTLDSTYEPELGYLNMTADEQDIQTDYNEYRCPVDYRIAQALLDFANGCKAAGLPVYLSSGYRSYDVQNQLLQRKISQGYDYDTAITIVAAPGTSEHQTGLCCDITDYYRETKNSTLADTETYKWLCEHCAEYGFVVRYPVDKSGDADSITGIIYEPWHFRYVGQEVAQYMTENNLCLEEFWDLYVPGTLES